MPPSAERLQATLVRFHYIALVGMGGVEHVGVADIVAVVGRLAQALGATTVPGSSNARARKAYEKRKGTRHAQNGGRGWPGMLLERGHCEGAAVAQGTDTSRAAWGH